MRESRLSCQSPHIAGRTARRLLCAPTTQDNPRGVCATGCSPRRNSRGVFRAGEEGGGGRARFQSKPIEPRAQTKWPWPASGEIHLRKINSGI